MAKPLTTGELLELRRELAILDKQQQVHLNGKILKPSDYYYYQTNPAIYFLI